MSGGGLPSAMHRRGRCAAAAVLLAGAWLLGASPAPAGSRRAAAAHEAPGALPDGRLALGKKGGVAVDPVCGMEVDEASARARGNASGHGGRTYFFCNPGCRAAFERDPGAYARGAAPPAAKAGVSLDPVCGMEVDESQARSKGLASEHGGMRRFFCNPACKAGFDRDPDRYLGAGAGKAGMPEGHGAPGR